MVITQTPFRMSFFGGGTDMPEFFQEYGGSVISTTFDKYCYVNARHVPPFFDYSNELVYSRIERVTAVDQIEHPLIRNVMKMLDMREIHLTYNGDLPARTGLGTSSSFAVGMLNAFHAMKGTYASKRRLADEAIKAERILCAEAGGWQDQVAAAYGGFNRIDFSGDSYEVRPIVMDSKRKRALEDSLMLFFTGFTRLSSKVQETLSYRDKTAELTEMLALVDEAEKVLQSKNTPLVEFGKLLDHTWRLKRGIGERVSTDGIDGLYERAITAGATGGKLLGAGGGGFLVFYVEQDRQQKVAEAMGDLMRIPFSFEEGGSRVIYFDPEDYSLDDEVSDNEFRD